MSELDFPQTMHVEETHDEPEGERQLTPREITMAAIAEKHEARRQEEMALGRIYDDDAREAGLTFPEDEQGREPVERERSARSRASAAARIRWADTARDAGRGGRWPAFRGDATAIRRTGADGRFGQRGAASVQQPAAVSAATATATATATAAATAAGIG